MIVLMVVLALSVGQANPTITSFTQEFRSQEACEAARTIVFQNTNAKVLLAQCTPK